LAAAAALEVGVGKGIAKGLMGVSIDCLTGDLRVDFIGVLEGELGVARIEAEERDFGEEDAKRRVKEDATLGGGTISGRSAIGIARSKSECNYVNAVKNRLVIR
jgi:hypothetical protein